MDIGGTIFSALMGLLKNHPKVQKWVEAREIKDIVIGVLVLGVIGLSIALVTVKIAKVEEPCSEAVYLRGRSFFDRPQVFNILEINPKTCKVSGKITREFTTENNTEIAEVSYLSGAINPQKDIIDLSGVFIYNVELPNNTIKKILWYETVHLNSKIDGNEIHLSGDWQKVPLKGNEYGEKEGYYYFAASKK